MGDNFVNFERFWRKEIINRKFEIFWPENWNFFTLRSSWKFFLLIFRNWISFPDSSRLTNSGTTTIAVVSKPVSSSNSSSQSATMTKSPSNGSGSQKIFTSNSSKTSGASGAGSGRTSGAIPGASGAYGSSGASGSSGTSGASGSSGTSGTSHGRSPGAIAALVSHIHNPLSNTKLNGGPAPFERGKSMPLVGPGAEIENQSLKKMKNSSKNHHSMVAPVVGMSASHQGPVNRVGVPKMGTLPSQPAVHHRKPIRATEV